MTRKLPSPREARSIPRCAARAAVKLPIMRRLWNAGDRNRNDHEVMEDAVLSGGANQVAGQHTPPPHPSAPSNRLCSPSPFSSKPSDGDRSSFPHPELRIVGR